jgi:hypothetical protein
LWFRVPQDLVAPHAPQIAGLALSATQE